MSMETEHFTDEFFDGDGDATEQVAEASPDIKDEPDQPEAPDQVAEAGETETQEVEDTLPPEDETPVTKGQFQAMLAEREKRQEEARARQEAEKRAADLEKRLAEFQRTQQEQSTQFDPIDDLDGFNRDLQGRMVAQRIEISEDMARMHHGDEVVDAAQRWAEENANSDPAMRASLQALGQDRNPYAKLIKMHKQAMLTQEIGDDPEAYKQRIIEEHLKTVGEAAPQRPAAPAAKVPPSLGKGGGGSTSTDEVMSDEDVFESMFRK